MTRAGPAPASPSPTAASARPFSTTGGSTTSYPTPPDSITTRSSRRRRSRPRSEGIIAAPPPLAAGQADDRPGVPHQDRGARHGGGAEHVLDDQEVGGEGGKDIVDPL